MRKKQVPMYMKLPADAVDKLRRAAETMGMTRKQVVTDLVTRYIEPGAPTMGRYSFQAYEVPEVMTAAQAGEFLQISEKQVIELAEAGKLPGKKLGQAWRFSRDGLAVWLSK